MLNRALTATGWPTTLRCSALLVQFFSALDTPLGDEENARLRVERLSAAEIQHLIANEIYPFGLRVIPDNLGATEEERVKTVAEVTLKGLKKMFPDIEIASESLEESAPK